MVSLLVLPLFIVLNRVRGGGFIDLPGRSLYWVSGIVAIIGCYFFGVTGIGLGLGYLLWGVPAWGRWYTLGRMDRSVSGAPNKIEAWLESKFESDYTLFFIRQLLIIPAALLAAPQLWFLAPIVPAIVVGCYELSWRYSPIGREIEFSEYFTGLLWGLLFCFMHAGQI